MQPYLPNLNDFVTSSGNGELVFKGQVVMSHASPSQMSIVGADFKPTPHPIPYSGINYLGSLTTSSRYFLFSINGVANSEGMVGGIQSWDFVSGNEKGIQSFNGTYSKRYINGSQQGFNISATIYYLDGTSDNVNTYVNGVE